MTSIGRRFRSRAAVRLSIVVALSACALPLLAQLQPAPASPPKKAAPANAARRAQEPVAPATDTKELAPQGDRAPSKEAPQALEQPWSPKLVVYLASAILVFGFGVMWLIVILVRAGKSGQEVLRLTCVPLIVIAAVFLMVVGYDENQLTPIVGLLGTIAGYLLGKGDEPTRSVT